MTGCALGFHGAYCVGERRSLHISVLGTLLAAYRHVGHVVPGALESSTCTHRRNGASFAVTSVMGPRVLVVDDDPDLRAMMAQLLTGEGFDTDVASNGQDALDKAHANPPRVIVLDMTMPVMDGWAFRAHQRHDVALAGIPVVVVSAVPPARLRNVGAAAALQKPVCNDELIAAIRAHC
jgi:CheY-like chemotaxis protein